MGKSEIKIINYKKKTKTDINKNSILKIKKEKLICKKYLIHNIYT